jgi:hypothetical protein
MINVSIVTECKHSRGVAMPTRTNTSSLYLPGNLRVEISVFIYPVIPKCLRLSFQ